MMAEPAPVQFGPHHSKLHPSVETTDPATRRETVKDPAAAAAAARLAADLRGRDTSRPSHKFAERDSSYIEVQDTTIAFLLFFNKSLFYH
jgi:hypothetical protein